MHCFIDRDNFESNYRYTCAREYFKDCYIFWIFMSAYFSVIARGTILVDSIDGNMS